MSSSLFLENGKIIKLRSGTYSAKDLGLQCQTIVKICLKAQSSLTITDPTVVYSKKNDSTSKVCEMVSLTLNKNAKLVIEEVCDGELPCPNEEWDYIIVGEGAAGAILARFLSNDRKTRVLSIEVGISHQDDPKVLTSNWINFANDLLYDPTYSVNYPIPFGPLLSQSYSEAVGRGGGSMHNFLQAVIPSPKIFDFWASVSGNPLWNHANMQPLVKVLETYTPNGTVADYTVRGRNGFINITQDAPVNVGNAVLDAFSTVTQVPYISDYNNYKLGPVGVSALQEFKTPGANSIRSYADRVLLRDGVIVDSNGNGLNGRKLKILTNAKVIKLEIDENKRATGVKYIFSDQNTVIREAFVNKSGTVILSAGAINSPKILLQSGVGPKAELENLGIEVKLDSPQVGKNLQNQYGTEVLFGAEVPNFAQVYFDTLHQQRREVQLTALNFGPTLTAVLPAILNPAGRGEVTIVTQNTQLQPKVTMSIYQDPEDIRIGVETFKVAKRVANLAGVPLIFPPPDHYPPPLGNAPNDDLLIADLKDPRFMIIQSHIVGTCRMAKSINDGVVDGNLKVFGLQNVMVVDASIQPLISDGNTCYPTYLLSLNALRILDLPLTLN
jgi:choline dehydrogenase